MLLAENLGLPTDGDTVLFDMEWTTWPGFLDSGWSLPGKHCEVIQIGAVRFASGDYRETASFEAMIKPIKNPVLSRFCTDLTGITNQRLDEEGIDLSQAVDAFGRFCIGARAIGAYGDDANILAANIRMNGLSVPRYLMDTIDLQRALVEARYVPSSPIPASSQLPEFFGLSSPGRPHDAQDDARCLLMALAQLSERETAIHDA